MKNPKVITVAGGFYFFGNEIQAAEGFICIDQAAMFGGFSGNKGVPAVCRGEKSGGVTVKLDRFDPAEKVTFPLTAVYAILPSVNLYEFKGAELR